MRISIKKLCARHRNLLLYCMIGCVGASLDFCIFSTLTKWGGVHHQIANIFSISAGIVTNFFLNYFFNFKSRGNLLLRLFCFYLVGLSGLGLSAILLWLFIDRLGISIIVSKIGTIFVVTAMQYTLNKAISFRKGKDD